MLGPLLANVVAIGLYTPPQEKTLLRFEVGLESAVTNVSSAWLWNSRGDAVLMDDGDAHSRGVEARVLLGMSRVYIGVELGVSQITSAPTLYDGHGPLFQGPLFRTSTTPPTSTGTAVTIAAPFGVQGTAGPILVGVEALIGWRQMTLSMHDGGPEVDGFVPLVETRARAGVWITPTLSLALIAGKGVIVNDSHSLCLALSLSKLPFDGER